jgi:hypothetical protein
MSQIADTLTGGIMDLRSSAGYGGILLRSAFRKTCCRKPRCCCCYIFRSALAFTPRPQFTCTAIWQWQSTANGPESFHFCPVQDFSKSPLRFYIGLARTLSELCLQLHLLTQLPSFTPFLHTCQGGITYPFLLPPSLSFIIISSNKSLVQHLILFCLLLLKESYLA